MAFKFVYCALHFIGKNRFTMLAIMIFGPFNLVKIKYLKENARTGLNELMEIYCVLLYLNNFIASIFQLFAGKS